MPVESVLFQARVIHTLEEEAEATSSDRPAVAGSVTGLLVQDGRIAAVGDATELLSEAPRNTIVRDFGDAVITPGLIDGHSHPITGLDWTAGADLSACLTLEAVQDVLRVQRRRLQPGEWLRGWGLNPLVFGDAAPSYRALGDCFTGVPAYLLMYDGHSAMASPEALALAGVAGEREFSSDARIVVDADGAPTGHVLELEATELITAAMPPVVIEERAGELLGLLEEMSRTGLVGARVMDCEGDAIAVVEQIESRTDLPIRLEFHPWVVPSRIGRLEEVLALQGLHGRRWRVAGVKFFLDGTIDGGTAWLEQPDCMGDGRTTPWGDENRFAETFQRVYRAGVNTVTHAIGDRAVREVCELVADLQREHGRRGHHRVEHIETVPDSVVSLFADRSVAASMQPLHATRFARADHSDTWSQRLGHERAENGFRCRDVRDAGAVLALGSDWPIAPFDPRITMADAMLRRPFDDPATEPVGGRQALTARQALEGYTSHGALASGEGDERGRLLVGMRADMTVWERDPLTAEPGELGALGIVATVVDGTLMPHA